MSGGRAADGVGLLAGQPGPAPARATDWMERAACRGQDPKLFFTEGNDKAAKQICGQCPVTAACRRFGRGEKYGTWGGESKADRTRRQRLAERGARNAGRPPAGGSR